MDLWQSVILGVVEGITEFLPVSSTGHLILTSRLLNIPSSDFLSSFEIAIQLGAILAVIVLYGKSLVLDRAVLARVMAAFVPTAVIGLAFYKVIKQVLLGSETVVVWALLLGGVVLVAFESLYREREQAIEGIAALSIKQAVLIGAFQSLAMVPGVSRSAATIIGGLCLGLKRRTIVEFSFLLAVPTMAAATGLDMIKSAAHFSTEQFGLLAVGFVVSFFVALAGIKLLLAFIKTHNFAVFGVYRILIALWVLIFWTNAV